MNVHELKILEQYFDDVATGKKKAEIRKNDRAFQTGDLLILREYHPLIDSYTGRVVSASVTHMYLGDLLPNDYVMLSIRVMK